MSLSPIHIQRSGATLCGASIRDGKKLYGYLAKPNANPLVILQPMGPVMFVFDVADVEPGPNAKKLPPGIEKPFEVAYGKIGGELEQTHPECQT